MNKIHTLNPLDSQQQNQRNSGLLKEKLPPIKSLDDRGSEYSQNNNNYKQKKTTQEFNNSPDKYDNQNEKQKQESIQEIEIYFKNQGFKLERTSLKLKESLLKYVRRKNIENVIQQQINEYESQKTEQLVAFNKQFEKEQSVFSKLTLKLVARISTTVGQSVLSFLACIVYVLSTYKTDQEIKNSTFYQGSEIVFASLFLVDYLYNIVTTKNKLKYIKKPMSIVDLLTILPVFVELVSGTEEVSVYTKVLGIVRVLRAFRILRLYRLFISSKPNQRGGNSQEQTEVQRKIVVISCTIIAIVFIAAGIVHAFESLDMGFDISTPEDNLSFDSAFYFMVVTVTTVGYGDFSPASKFSQILIGFFIIIIIVLISQQTSELNELMQFNSKYGKAYSGPTNHVILLGSVNQNNLSKFLKEFYHPDHAMKEDIKILIIQEEEPSEEIQNIIHDPQYDIYLQYMKGDIFNEDTLSKAKISDDTSIIILADQFNNDSNKADTSAILATNILNQYNSKCKIYAQLVDFNILFHSWADYDIAMSTHAFKMGIIAGNIFNKGYSTFMSNLITSSSVSNSVKKKLPVYALEYCHGLSHEIYSIDFMEDQSKLYVGKPFVDAVQIIYKSTGILLMGVKSKNALESQYYDMHEIFLNPVNYIIKEDDYGIVLAKDFNEAAQIWDFSDQYVNDILQEKQTDRNQESGKKSQFECNISNINGKEENENFILTEQEMIYLQQLKTEVNPKYSEIQGNIYSIIYMFENDLRGKIKDHIIVFGNIQDFESLIDPIRHYSQQHILFVTNQAPDEKWTIMEQNYSNISYCVSSLNSVEELKRLAIEQSFHIVLLTQIDKESSIQDSALMPLIRLIEENFQQVNFTIELLDENNMKNMNYTPEQTLGINNIAHNLYPRYTSSNVFLSSTIEYIMAQVYHTNLIIDIIGKLISSNPQANIKGVPQNSRIRRIKIPNNFEGQNIRYGDVFTYLIQQPIPIIPIGIYRDKNFETNKLPYIVTNPINSAPIVKGDFILVIGDFVLNEVELNIKQLENVRFQEQKQNVLNQDEYNNQEGDFNLKQKVQDLLESNNIAVGDDLIVKSEQICKEDAKLYQKNTDKDNQHKQSDDLIIDQIDEQLQNYNKDILNKNFLSSQQIDELKQINDEIQSLLQQNKEKLNTIKQLIY